MPGLRPGDLLTPGHSRNHFDGCEVCAARASGRSHRGMDPPSKHVAVYATTSRLYGAYHASLYGHGDLYRVEMDPATMFASTEDSFETWCAPTALVAAVLDRAVLLSASQRRRLYREWRAGDIARGKDPIEWSDFAHARRLGVALRHSFE